MPDGIIGVDIKEVRQLWRRPRPVWRPKTDILKEEMEEEKRLLEMRAVPEGTEYRPLLPPPRPTAGGEPWVWEQGVPSLPETKAERVLGEWVMPMAALGWIPPARLGWQALAPLIAKGGLPKVAGIAARTALAPFVGAEKALGIFGALGKRGIAKLLPKPEPIKPLMTDLSPFEEIVEVATTPDMMRKIANLRPFRTISRIIAGKAASLKPMAEATTADKALTAIVGRDMLRAESVTKAAGVIAPLQRLGTSSKVFDLAPDGTMAKGILKGTHLNDIRTYPDKYIKDLTPQQKFWIDQATEIEKAKLEFLRRNGIEINELTFEEGGQYAGRRVYAKVSNEGELLETARVGIGVGRPGAKAPFEKTRVFRTAEEATKDGFRYLPEEDTLYFNVQAAYSRVVDKQMTDWFLRNVSWRTAGTPEELAVAQSIARMKYDHAKRAFAYFQRAGRGEKLPEQSIKSIEKWFPELDFRQAVISVGGRQQVLKTIKQLMQTTKGEAVLAKEAARQARRRLQQAGFEEAQIGVPAFAGKIFTGAQAREAARIFGQEMAPQYSEALGQMNKANSFARFMVLAGDASPFTIQLLFLAGASPRIYTKTFAGFVQSLFNPQFIAKFYTKHAETIAKSKALLLAGGGQTEFTEAMSRAGLLRTKPLSWAGKVLEPFQRGFESALDMAGIYMREAYDHLATTPERATQVESFINEFRGLLSSARIGVGVGQRQFETAALLAPRYNRAIAALLSDVFRGNLRGSLAREALTKGIAAISAMSVAVSLALDEDMDEIIDHFNPTSENFMTWNMYGQKIGPGGKVRQLLRLMGQIIEEPESLLEPKEGGYLWSNPLLRFVRSNLAPVPSTALDLLMGTNFVGDPTREGLVSFSEEILARNLFPIWVQSLWEEGGNWAGTALRAAGEFFGLRVYPEEPTRGRGGRGGRQPTGR